MLWVSSTGRPGGLRTHLKAFPCPSVLFLGASRGLLKAPVPEINPSRFQVLPAQPPGDPVEVPLNLGRFCCLRAPEREREMEDLSIWGNRSFPTCTQHQLLLPFFVTTCWGELSVTSRALGKAG